MHFTDEQAETQKSQLSCSCSQWRWQGWRIGLGYCSLMPALITGIMASKELPESDPEITGL